MTNLQDKVALITGSARGIGKAIAERFGGLGASVVVNYSKGEKQAQETVAAIERLGGTGIAIQADVSQVGDIDRLFSTALERSRHGNVRRGLRYRHLQSSVIAVWAAAMLWARPNTERGREADYCAGISVGRVFTQPRPKADHPGASTVNSAPGICGAAQECAGPRCLNSAAWSFTKSRMFVGASPVSLYMVSVMRS